MRKIAITGPESTGKTTLASTLADSYCCVWIPEYAREYLELNGPGYQTEDLLNILEGQLLRMQFAEQANCPYLFYDTEVLVLKVWYEFKYGHVHPEIERAWKEQKMDLYFLCNIDSPWVSDPLREHPDHRKELMDMYINHLNRSGRNYKIISGNPEERISQAKASII